MKNPALISSVFLLLFFYGCRNREINEGEKFRPRELHDDFNNSHFNKVTIDGVDYLMMERDNNSPHEGFGFMAFRANKLIEKQDSVLSYLRTMQYFQNKIYAGLNEISEESAQNEFNRKFNEFISKEKNELNELEKEELINQN